MQMLGEKYGVRVPGSDVSAILEELSTAPAYPEVPQALERLREGGYRLVALTNGTRKAAKSQLKSANIGSVFEEILSADDVEQCKPGPKPYLHAAAQVALKPGKVLMVAAHAWDLQGAHAVGMYTAFLIRKRQVLNPLASKPDYIAKDLADLAEQLL